MKNKNIIFCLLAVLFLYEGIWLQKAYSQEKPETKARIAVVPTSQPDRIILSWSDDPATTQSVTWRCSTDVTESFAEIALTTQSPTFPKNKRSFTATSSLGESSNMNYRSFSFTFTDLEPGTTYSYRVGQGENWSPWSTFTTAGKEDRPFTFLYFGDAQNGLNTVYPQLVRKAFLSTLEAKFAIFCGDLVDDGKNERSWDDWFDAMGFLSASYPIMPIPGNHEHAGYKEETGDKKPILTPLWKDLFTLPENGPESMKESCYTFVYEGVRFIGLDSAKGSYEYRGENEIAQWLKNVLENNSCLWTIVYLHHPIYSSAKKRDNLQWRRAIKPLLDQYGVDLVLQGHDHVYSRTDKHTPTIETIDLQNAEELDTNSQTIYVTSVAGEKMYELENRSFFIESLPNTQLFQTIHIEGNTLTFKSITVTGKVIDSFVIEKLLFPQD